MPKPKKKSAGNPPTSSPDTAPAQPKIPDNKFPVVVRNKLGRPAIYSQYLAGIICERLIHGQSLKKICQDDEMPAIPTILRWVVDVPGFSAQYALAMQQRAETHVEEIFEIADNVDNDTIIDPVTGNLRPNNDWINRARLRVDVRKWHSARMNPKKYGDKVEHVGAGGGAIQVAQITINAQDMQPEARAALREAILLTSRKPDEGEEDAEG